MRLGKRDWLNIVVDLCRRYPYKVVDNGEELNYGCAVCGRPWSRYIILIDTTGDGFDDFRGDPQNIGKDCLRLVLAGLKKSKV